VAGSVTVAGSGYVAGCSAVAGSSDAAGNGDAAALRHQCSVFATLLSQQGSAFSAFQVYLWDKAWVAQYTRLCPLSSNQDSTAHDFGGTTPRAARCWINIPTLQSYRLWSLLSAHQFWWASQEISIRPWERLRSGRS